MASRWNTKLDDAYGPAMKFTVAVQLVLLLLSGMILDLGYTSRIVAIAMLAFWASVLILVMRNPRTASKWDLVYICAGFLPILVVTWLVAHRVWA